MRSQIVLFIALAVSLFNGMQLFAQSNGDTKGPPAPNTNRTPPIDASMPIDDNILILIIAGIALATYYFWQKRTAKKKLL